MDKISIDLRVELDLTDCLRAQGTSAFGPNLNIIRDPRYGRNSELPGEDPLLTAEYGIAVVNAMQETDGAGKLRLLLRFPIDNAEKSPPFCWKTEQDSREKQGTLGSMPTSSTSPPVSTQNLSFVDQ